ncbi:hypothetical protein [Halothermothrix orenii]|uniref:2'-5' RNA ligase n=1 Tax=Halothermothrix orenii (strain H 168 / OCM 544 / DSM 9562) TaxID=373903 RepID=B8D1H7_HALOH|nr:hypothetical protein [Halothermothrix orenii]ACL69054.1 hypothetical protein Hore_02930 [Halothermothrix orenii H 168]
MIQPASLESEHFIVLIPRGKVYSLARGIQKFISENCRISDDVFFPEIHITLDRIKKGYRDEVVAIVEKVINKYKKIDICVNTDQSFHFYQNNFLVMDILNEGPLMEFALNLHRELEKRGLSTINNYHQWDLHITLLSNLFASRPIPDKLFRHIYYYISYNTNKKQYASEADRLEVWRPEPDPENRCLASFKL